MNVETITMDREEARERMNRYREGRRRDNEAEYRAIEAAYEQLAEGAALIDADLAVRQAGVFESNGLPKLAIARADRKEVQGGWTHGVGQFRFYCGSQFRWPAANSPTLTYELTFGEQLSWEKRRQRKNWWTLGYAMVPIVPPEARPSTGQLREWHILWEVDQWHRNSKTTPPTDPMLLKHLGGPMFAVLSTWDLTPLERMVLGQLRDSQENSQ